MKRIYHALRKSAFIIYLLSLMFVIESCDKAVDSPVEENSKTRGGIESSSWLMSVKTDFIKAMMDSAQINVAVSYDVDVYKIVYYTDDTKGNLTIASGALFVPKGKDNLSLMSLQHGTQTARNKAGSVNPINDPEGFISAGQGFFTLIPDYLGLGESQILHPYLHEKTSAGVVIDFIRACRKEANTLNIKLNGQVFLAGYSEGGYVTLAAHKEIQLNYGNEITVTASAPMAGPYDLYLTSKTILKNATYGKPSYIAFLAAAYNDIYGWNNLNGIFNPPYAERIPALIGGAYSLVAIDAQLTTDLTKLFNQDFVSSFLNGTESKFTNALIDNSLINWTPAAPIRFYHGDQDQYVPYQNSEEARDYFRSKGCSVELVTIGGGDHISSAAPSIVGAVAWFNSIRLNKLLVYN